MKACREEARKAGPFSHRKDRNRRHLTSDTKDVEANVTFVLDKAHDSELEAWDYRIEQYEKSGILPFLLNSQLRGIEIGG